MNHKIAPLCLLADFYNHHLRWSSSPDYEHILLHNRSSHRRCIPQGLSLVPLATSHSRWKLQSEVVPLIMLRNATARTDLTRPLLHCIFTSPCCAECQALPCHSRWAKSTITEWYETLQVDPLYPFLRPFRCCFIASMSLCCKKSTFRTYKINNDY